MKSKVQILWENNQIFAGLDGIVYSDRILTVDYINPTENKYFYKSVITGETTIEEELATYPEPYQEIHPDGTRSSMPDPNNILEIGLHIDKYQPSLPYNNGHIYFGSGEMGQDGFVAYATNDNQFIWSISLDINPICFAEIKDSYLYFTSTRECKAKINLECLTDIEFTHKNWLED